MDNIQHLITKRVNQISPMYYYIISVCSFFLLWFFTYFQFEFGLSVFFAIILVLSLSKIQIIGGIVFGLVYAYVMYHLFQDRKKISGDVIKETNMELNGKPFVASENSLQVSSNQLGKSGDTSDFSYSFWLYINSVPVDPNNKDYQKTWFNYRYGDWKSVFYRGNDMSITSNDGNELSGITGKQQFPGVWLAPTKNQLSIVFQNGEDGQKVERVDIEDVPLNRWFQMGIVVEGNSVNIFLDGKLENIIVLNQMIPSDIQEKDIYICKDSFMNFAPTKQEISQEYRCPDGCIDDDTDDDNKDKNKSGFAGFIGEMVYFPYVLKNEEIEKNYEFYKKIIDSYQKTTFSEKVSFPPLITSTSKTSVTYTKPDFEEKKGEM